MDSDDYPNNDIVDNKPVLVQGSVNLPQMNSKMCDSTEETFDNNFCQETSEACDDVTQEKKVGTADQPDKHEFKDLLQDKWKGADPHTKLGCCRTGQSQM